MPVYGTIASQFNDPGVNTLFIALIEIIKEKTGVDFNLKSHDAGELPEKIFIIPPKRVRYLSEISETIRTYNEWVEKQGEIAQKLYSINETIKVFEESGEADESSIILLKKQYRKTELDLDGHNKLILDKWEERVKAYKAKYFIFKVRDKEFKLATHTESLSHLQIPKISLFSLNLGLKLHFCRVLF